LDSQSVTGAKRTSEKLTVKLDRCFATVALCFNKDWFVSLVDMFEEDSGNGSTACGLEAGTLESAATTITWTFSGGEVQLPSSVYTTTKNAAVQCSSDI